MSDIHFWNVTRTSIFEMFDIHFRNVTSKMSDIHFRHATSKMSDICFWNVWHPFLKCLTSIFEIKDIHCQNVTSKMSDIHLRHVTSKMSDIHFCNIWHPFLIHDIHFCNSWHPLSKCDIQNVWHPFLKWLELDIQFQLSECGHPIPKFIVDVWHPLFWNWMSAGAIWMSHSTQNGFGCLTSKFGPNWMLGSSTFLWWDTSDSDIYTETRNLMYAGRNLISVESSKFQYKQHIER